MVTNDVIETMATARAMRYLKADPVPDELVDAVLFAATRASSPGNTQGWTFVVMRDPANRARLGEVLAPLGDAMRDLPLPDDPTERRTLLGARNMLSTMANAPVIVFVCAENIYPPHAPNERWMLSAAYAATQNLCVAARSLGLGTVFSTFHSRCEPEVRALLGLPDHVHLVTTVPLGWPAKPFGPVTRKPMDEVVRNEHW